MKAELNIEYLPEENKITPSVISKKIDSALGFTYSSLTSPIKYMRFPGEVFEKLMSLPLVDAMEYYGKIRTVTKPTHIVNFNYAIGFLIWERAVLDKEFRRRLSLVKDYKLVSHKLRNNVKISHPRHRFYTPGLNCTIKSLKNNKGPWFIENKDSSELFGDIYTFDKDTFDKRYIELKELAKEIDF